MRSRARGSLGGPSKASLGQRSLAAVGCCGRAMETRAAAEPLTAPVPRDDMSTRDPVVRRNDYSSGSVRPFRAAHVTDEKNPRPHARQEGQASSVTRPLEGRHETKKARSVVASSRVHPWRTSVSRSPPTAGLGVGLQAPAAVRPLVRMPTDRHAATGTCELGNDYLRKYGMRFKQEWPRS